MVGTRGVPARYGGFETAVEEVGSRLAAAGHSVVVYCRNNGQRGREHKQMELVNLPALRFKQTETLSHTALSVIHLMFHTPEVAIVFNAANAPLLPFLRRRRIPTAVHVDGLEWKRAKWSGVGRGYYQYAERLAVRWADRLIADAEAIQAYYAQRYGTGSTYIPYGAPIQEPRAPTRLRALDLQPRRYHLVVARMEPENNLDVIVGGFAQSDADLPLVVVGTAPHAAEYGRAVRELARGREVRFLGSVWNQDLLDELYANSLLYLHGHSVGGTNPSLLRAMGAGAPIGAYDVVFNREVLGETGAYFGDPSAVAALIQGAERSPEAEEARGLAAQARAADRYDWDAVADQYESLCMELAVMSKPRRSTQARRYLASDAGSRR